VTAGVDRHEIEVVRGRLDDERAQEILRFWEDLGALHGEEARRRLPEVVCVLRDGDSRVAGVNSVYPQSVDLIGSRLFWIYRSRLGPGAVESDRAMFKAAFEALQSEFDPERGGPIGLCLVIADRAEMKRHPEAEWPDPRTLYAGYLPDASQVRIAYFAGAKI
jgi:hypothetical protein